MSCIIVVLLTILVIVVLCTGRRAETLLLVHSSPLTRVSFETKGVMSLTVPRRRTFVH